MLTLTGYRIIEKILTKLLPFVGIWEVHFGQDLSLIYWVTVENILHLDVKPRARLKAPGRPLLKAIEVCWITLEIHPVLNF